MASPWAKRCRPARPLKPRLAACSHGCPSRSGVRGVTALLLASLVAGLATMPYAAYHFHRLAPYGVLANLLAMPVVSALVMPMGILGVVTMPFGFDAMFCYGRWHRLDDP